MAILLRHPYIDRKVARRLFARDIMRHHKRHRRALLGQAIDAQPTAKAAGFDDEFVLIEGGEIAVDRGDIGFDRERTGALLFEPKIEARHIAGRH